MLGKDEAVSLTHLALPKHQEPQKDPQKEPQREARKVFELKSTMCDERIEAH